MERFAKYSKFYSIDFFHFFAKRRKLAEKTTHRKKNRGHRTSKIVKSMQSQSNGHLPYYCSLYYLARALDAWCGMRISCAVRMHRNNWRECPKGKTSFSGKKHKIINRGSTKRKHWVTHEEKKTNDIYCTQSVHSDLETNTFLSSPPTQSIST